MEAISWLSSAVAFVLAHFTELVAGLVGLLTAVITIALLIPGPEPETFLQKVVEFLKPWSKK